VPDPFEALRTAPTPIDPDAAFAARLRARLVRALYPPQQGEPSMTSQTSETTERLRQGDMSYVSLLVPEIQRAARFYADVLGWTYTPEPKAGPVRQIEGQATAQGLTEIASSDEFLQRLGRPARGTPSPSGYVAIVVDDLAAAADRVRGAGGWASDRMEQAYGAVVACVDDQGLAFTIHEVPAGMPAQRSPATGARQGDVAYMVFELPDANRGRAFYGSVLGVQFSPGRDANSWNMFEIAPMAGLSGGHNRPCMVPMYRVDDIQAAVQRVRQAGGTASEPVNEGYGIRAECADDQGVRFHLGQLPLR
jgi:predicted enzyme related to lactoylglutathione lyase